MWNPIAEMEVTVLGLYDDTRFPGQCLLSLKEHHEDFTLLDARVANRLMADARDAASAIQKVTGAARVNYAILGNHEPHLHVHLIPRHPSREPRPREAPWSDPRPHEALPDHARAALIENIARALRS